MEPVILEDQVALTSDDFCSLCAPERREQQLAPNIKILLPERTSNIELMIKVCPECDGEAAVLGLRGKNEQE